MCRKKYLLVFGTRPEAIKMAPVLSALATEPGAKCVVCISGQHEELVRPILSLFSIVPDYNLHAMTLDQSLNGLTSILLREIDAVIAKEHPDWVLVQGDTTTAMAASMAACYGRVRVAHIEAGIRSHNKVEPFPEEINRRIIDQIADLHFAPTILDKYELVREGLASDSIHVTGNTSIDALRYVANLPFAVEGSLLAKLPLSGRRIILVTVHRRENHGAPLREICSAVRLLAQRYKEGAQIVLPVHPNPNVNGPVRELLDGIENVSLLPPLGYQELIFLVQSSYFVMTDSGGLQEETPWLGKPALVLRNVTDRREAILAGAARLVGTKMAAIVDAASELMEHPVVYRQMARSRNLFGDGLAGLRIARILQADGVQAPLQQATAPATVSPATVSPAETRPAIAIPTGDLLPGTVPTFEAFGN